VSFLYVTSEILPPTSPCLIG